MENPRFFLMSKVSVIAELPSVSVAGDVQDVGVRHGALHGLCLPGAASAGQSLTLP